MEIDFLTKNPISDMRNPQHVTRNSKYETITNDRKSNVLNKKLVFFS